MKVLITGAAGKVGRMVRRALIGHHAMRFLDVVPVEGTEGEMVVGSILDRETLTAAMQGMDAVIHLAYGARNDMTPEAYEDLSFRVNTQGTFLVAQAAAAAGVRRFVYASTLSLYEGNMPPAGEQFSEEHPPAPRGIYALTKYFGEEALRAYAREGKLSVISLRLTLPTEPEEWEAVRQQHPDSGRVRTAAIDVGNAFRLALEKPDATFEVIHIASGTPGCPWSLGKARRVLGYQPTVLFS
ncbi:MAG TPA: NAD(P)-dependent oxidoreductase [Armatimonadetes bacterium]|nr:NAD(P)-dependent oxidoreductase [Armatimonadota bacterium]